MQEVDAQHRLAILRGEAPPPIENDSPKDEVKPSASRPDGDFPAISKRKRKRQGEDDTDFELRLAKERAEPGERHMEVVKSSSAPILDQSGHIDLFGDERSRAHAQKNDEAEKERAKKEKEYEDQYTMRFSNAAGKDGIRSRPWYSQGEDERRQAPLKDMWGNEDPKRKERDAKRVNSNDPLAMMKQGASKIREIKQERKKMQEERDDELRQMRKDDRRREKRSDIDERRSRHHERRSSRPRRGSQERSRHSERDHRKHRHEERSQRRDSRSPRRERPN